MRPVLLAAMLPAPALVACNGPDQGTTISVTGDGADGNRHGAAMDGATGQVKVDLPGFQGSFKLPKVQMGADDLELNGVKLYPGSKIGGVSVDARDGGRDDGSVRIAFDSPASAAAVRGWFAERLPRAGFKVSGDGAGLTGTTEEGKPFALKLDDAGAGRATGTITIG